MLGKMKASGVSPDVISFSTILNGWANSGKLKEALEIMEKMEGEGIVPDVQIFSILIKACSRSQNCLEAEKLVEKMGKRGINPNVVSYTTVISCYCSKGEMNEAIRVFEGMEGAKVKGNELTFRTLVWGFCEAKEPTKADLILDRMEASGMFPDSKSYQLLAQSWRDLGVESEAEKVEEKGKLAILAYEKRKNEEKLAELARARNQSSKRGKEVNQSSSYKVTWKKSTNSKDFLEKSDPKKVENRIPRKSLLNEVNSSISCPLQAKNLGIRGKLFRFKISKVGFQAKANFAPTVVFR